MKKTVLATASIVIASLLCLVACAAAPSEAIVEVTCDEFNKQATINKEVEVALDGLLTIYLCSDPNKVFEWSWHVSGPRIVDEVDLGSEPPKGDVGIANMDVRTFTAWERGNTTLVLEQYRPVAPEEKGPWKLNLDVTVR